MSHAVPLPLWVWHPTQSTCSKKCRDKLMYFASASSVPATPVLPMRSELQREGRETEGGGEEGGEGVRANLLV